MQNLHNIIIPCPKLQEDLVALEAQNLGLSNIKAARSVVYASGDLGGAYKMCLYARVASRVLWQLLDFKAQNVDDLYEGIYAFAWSDHIPLDASICIEFNGNLNGINNSHFAALKVKDAIVDKMRATTGSRPNIDLKNPDLKFHIYANHGKVTLALDLAGQGLHRRGYRTNQGAASLKENLAAALLLRSNWADLAAQNYALVDPMCASGTLLIEGAYIAANIAPNWQRKNWGFNKWLGHIPALWQQIYANAQKEAQVNISKASHWIRGFESDPRLILPARTNIERAGLSNLIKVYQGELASFEPKPDAQQLGLIICNPPYGVRLGQVQNLAFLYQELGQKLRQNCPNWQAAILSGEQSLTANLGKVERKNKFYNGAIACDLVHLDLINRPNQAQSNNLPANQNEPLSSGAQMVANRLRKNLAKLKTWLKRENISCFRLYDADMPEYAFALDIYGDFAHVQEYAPPSSIDPNKAQIRFNEALTAIAHVLQLPKANIFSKTRMRQKDAGQYQKQDASGNLIQVKEGKVKLLVNLRDYLDTGLFLDHRPLRLRIAQEAKNARFLNLFCYTGAATLHALGGGARCTTSVDLSNTYLNWLRSNLALNGYSDTQNVIKADCMQWLAEDSGEYDLIYVDPPTFANSKKKHLQFDVQRDHVHLLDLAMLRLAKNGVLYFSTNFQKFKLDPSLLERYSGQEISQDCLDLDFKRNPKIHLVWQKKPIFDLFLL